MRKFVALAPALLAACSTAPAAPADPPARGETPGHACTPEGLDQFVGKTRSDAVEADIKRVSNAAVVRWAPPGAMMTMDFRADRVTAWLDAANTITKIRCG
jgi:peptidase inhibitor I78 family protein